MKMKSFYEGTLFGEIMHGRNFSLQFIHRNFSWGLVGTRHKVDGAEVHPALVVNKDDERQPHFPNNAFSLVSHDICKPQKLHFYFNEIKTLASCIQVMFCREDWSVNEFADSLAKQGIVTFKRLCIVQAIESVLVCHACLMRNVWCCEFWLVFILGPPCSPLYLS